MSKTIAITLDDETAAYLERIAADQGRTPAEVAAWIVADDLRRERAIDAEIVSRLEAQQPLSSSWSQRERPSA